MAFLAIALALLVAGLAVFWIEPLSILPLLEHITPNIIYRVTTSHPLVALSFDDGPDPTFTPQVLEVLDRCDAKATFFLIGERALRHPELVSRIKAAGHEVGNHYFRNASTLFHSDTSFITNLDDTAKAIGVAAELKLFRPPGGVAWPKQLRLARDRGYKCALGCAYPHDPSHPPAGYIRWLIQKNLFPGAIVILHDGIPDPSRSIQALPHILAAGHSKGLRFVSISSLLEKRQPGPWQAS